MDVGYWESLLQQLKAHIALTRLKEQHQAILKKRLAKLKLEVYINFRGINLSDIIFRILCSSFLKVSGSYIDVYVI